MNPVRTLVIGAGNFGRMHARSLHGLAEAQLVGVVDHNAAALQTLRQSLPDVQTWTRLDDALATTDAEAFIIATRTDSHVPIAKQLLSAGKTILVEKPLAQTDVEAQTLAPLIAPDSANFMAGHIVLFAPEFQRLVRDLHTHGPPLHFSAFRYRPRAQGDLFPEETPLRMTMVHDLYLALALTGGQTPAKLTAQYRRRPDGRADLALAWIHWPDGTLGSFAAAFITPPGMPEDGFDRLEVYGESWAARLRLNPQPYELFTDRAQWPIGLNIDDDPARPSGWLAEELRCFCRIVRKQSPVPLGARFQDALAIQQWLRQLEQSTS
jgi:predicted dehydrogenase